MDLFELRRPEHVDDPAWHAVSLAQTRLQRAWEWQDLHEVIGKSKELVETVAKVVVSATEGTVEDGADFAPTIKSAQRCLGRQPGRDVSQDQNLRAMAQAAQTLATSIAPVRNSHGTGHGRARVPDVVDEMALLTLEAALLWSRWALRRLGHVLADYPNDLIAAVRTGTSRTLLREKFELAALGQQTEDVQHRIGVAFGQQSAGGFGNATEVGVEAAIEGGYGEYPIAYRLGLLKGMLLTAEGSIGLTDFYATRFVSLLASLPEGDAVSFLEEARIDVAQATWIDTWRGSTEIVPTKVVTALRGDQGRIPVGYRDLFSSLCDDLDESGKRAEVDGSHPIPD